MIHHSTDFMWFILSAMAATTAAGVAVAHPSSEELQAALWWGLLPFVGSLLSSGMAFFLSSADEPRKKVLGRALGALLTGIAIPRGVVFFKPEIKDIIQDPILLVASGSFFGLIGFAVSAKLVEWTMKTAPNLLERKLNNLTNETDTPSPSDSPTARLH